MGRLSCYMAVLCGFSFHTRSVPKVILSAQPEEVFLGEVFIIYTSWRKCVTCSLAMKWGWTGMNTKVTFGSSCFSEKLISILPGQRFLRGDLGRGRLESFRKNHKWLTWIGLTVRAQELTEQLRFGECHPSHAEKYSSAILVLSRWWDSRSHLSKCVIL